MRSYGYQQEKALLSGPKFADDQSERVCPVCDQTAVRIYTYRNVAAHRTTRITYAWCANCRHFKGWTGVYDSNHDFTDPLESLSQEERRELEDDFDGFFHRLDELWNEGQLPQHPK